MDGRVPRGVVTWKLTGLDARNGHRLVLGRFRGCADGASHGCPEGCLEGNIIGCCDGVFDGLKFGCRDGWVDGFGDGCLLGGTDGFTEGIEDGWIIGCFVG